MAKLHKWAAAPLLVSALILLTLLRYSAEREPLLIYTRSGGIAGFAEKLVVYQDGEAVFSSKTQVIEGKVSEEDMRELLKSLDELRKIGNAEYEPKEGVADFFCYTLSSKGLSISWVDPWASKEEIPSQLESFSQLISKIVEKLRSSASATRPAESTQRDHY